MSVSVNKNGFTPFAKGGCQSLLQSTRMGLHPLVMVDVKVCYSQQEWFTPFLVVDVNGFTPFANGRCQSLLLSTRMGSHPLLMVDVKSGTVNKNGFTPFANGGCPSLLQLTSMVSHPLLMVDVKVYYSQRVWVHTLC